MIRTFAAAFATLLVTAGAANASTVVAVETTDIWSARDANMVCQSTAATSAWTGHWNTTEWGAMSVCNCEVGTYLPTRFDVEAGPIWNQRHAQQICPQVCSSATWTGRFSTARRNGVSACDVAYSGQIRGAIQFAPARPVVVRAPVRVVAPVVARPTTVYRVPSRRGYPDRRVVLGYPGRARVF